MAPPRFRITWKHMVSYRIAIAPQYTAGSDGGAINQGADELRGSGRGGVTVTWERGRGPRRDTIRQKDFPSPPAHPAAPRRTGGGGDPQTIATHRRQAFRPDSPPASSAGSAEHPAWCRCRYRGSCCRWWRCFRRDYHLGIVILVVKQNRERGRDEKRAQQCWS